MPSSFRRPLARGWLTLSPSLSPSDASHSCRGLHWGGSTCGGPRELRQRTQPPPPQRLPASALPVLPQGCCRGIGASFSCSPFRLLVPLHNLLPLPLCLSLWQALSP